MDCEISSTSCPKCLRPFRDILEYPYLRMINIEWNKIPNFIEGGRSETVLNQEMCKIYPGRSMKITRQDTDKADSRFVVLENRYVYRRINIRDTDHYRKSEDKIEHVKSRRDFAIDIVNKFGPCGGTISTCEIGEMIKKSEDFKLIHDNENRYKLVLCEHGMKIGLQVFKKVLFTYATLEIIGLLPD